MELFVLPISNHSGSWLVELSSIAFKLLFVSLQASLYREIEKCRRHGREWIRHDIVPKHTNCAWEQKIQCHAMQTFSQRVSRKLAIKGKISDNENKLDFGLQKHAYFRWTTGHTVTFVLFWFEIGYGFRGNYCSAWTYSSFQFQMREREKERCEFGMNFNIPFCSCSNLSNDEIIS